MTKKFYCALEEVEFIYIQLKEGHSETVEDPFHMEYEVFDWLGVYNFIDKVNEDDLPIDLGQDGPECLLESEGRLG